MFSAQSTKTVGKTSALAWGLSDLEGLSIPNTAILFNLRHTNVL